MDLYLPGRGDSAPTNVVMNDASSAITHSTREEVRRLGRASLALMIAVSTALPFVPSSVALADGSNNAAAGTGSKNTDGGSPSTDGTNNSITPTVTPVTTPGSTTSPVVMPTAPTGITVTPLDGGLRVSWNAGPAAEQLTGHDVRWSLNGTEWTAVESVRSSKANTVDITGLTNGAVVYVKVAGINSVGVGVAVTTSGVPAARASAPRGAARIATPASGTPYNDAVTASGPVGYWPMTDNYQSTAAAGTVGGTLNGQSSFGMPAPIGGTSSAYVQGRALSSTIRVGRTFSVEAWVNPSSIGGDAATIAAIGDDSNGAQLLVSPDGALQFVGLVAGNRTRVVTSRGDVTPGGWNHVVAAVENGTVTLWVNGVRVGGGQVSVEPGTVSFGATTDSGRAFIGSFAHLAVYSTALVAGDVTAHYTASGYSVGTGHVPTARGGDRYVMLDWSAPATDGGSRIVGYRIEANDGSGWVSAITNTWSTSTSAFVTNLTDGTRLSNGTSYRFRVRAVTEAGAGDASDEVSATPRGTASEPRNFDATVPTTGTAQFSWSAPDNDGGFAITGYRIEVSEDGGATWRLFATTSADTRTYGTTDILTGIPFADAVYSFRVRAESGAGVGTSTVAIALAPQRATQPARAQSVPQATGSRAAAFDAEQRALEADVAAFGNIARATATGGVPGRVSNLTGTPGVTSATITWSAPTDTGSGAVTGYTVQQSTTGGGGTANWTTISSNATSPTVVSSLTASTVYFFRVFASNATGAGTPTVITVYPTSATTYASMPTGTVDSPAALADTGSTTRDAYNAAVTADNPVGWWRLDDAAGSTTAKDWGSAATNGTPTGATFGATTVSGSMPTALTAPTGTSSMYLPGSASHVSVPNSAAWQTNRYSVELWFNTKQTTGWMPLFYVHDGTRRTLSLYLNAATREVQSPVYSPQYAREFAVASGQYAWAADQWNHVVVTNDGTWSSVYLNGQVVSRVRTQLALYPSTARTITFGREGAAGTAYFQGLLSNVAYYGDALSPSRVQTHYQAAGLSTPVWWAPNAVAGDGRVALSWNEPAYASGSILYYEVQQAAQSNGTVSAWTTVGTSVTNSITVSGLTNNTTYAGMYQFQVRAVTTNGAGAWSQAVAVSPYGTAEAPNPLTASQSGNGQVTLSWTAPTTTNLGGAITGVTGYRIERSNDGGTTWTVLTENSGSATSYVVDGLANGSAYLFRVAAQTSSGLGDWSTVTATPAVAPPAVRNLRGDPVTLGTVNLSWTAPAVDGGLPILYYVLDYCSTQNCTTFTNVNAAVPASATSYTVTNMANQAGGITFRLRPVNAVGTGDASQVIVRTAPQVSAPTGLTATPQPGSQGRIDLAWTAPDFLFGATVMGYRIESSADNGSTWSVVATNSSALSIGAYSLIVGTRYQFRVAAVTSFGPGQWNYVSAVVPGSTSISGSIATAPLNLAATTDASGSVLLTWAAPTYSGNSPITGYRVRYLGTTDADVDTTGAFDSNLPADATSIRLNGLVNGTAYYVRVNAITASGQGDIAAVGFTPYARASAPTTITATPANGTTTLSWAAPADNGGYAVYGYRVEQSTDGANWAVLTQDTNTTSFTARGLMNGTTYQYRVAAVTGVGIGAFASIVSTPFTRANAPLNPVATVSSQTVTLTWSQPSNGGSAITGYIIERCPLSGSYWTSCDAWSDPTHGSHYSYWNGAAWYSMWTQVGSTSGAGSTSFTLTGLVNGPSASYQFIVIAVNAAGKGLPSSVIAANPGGVPAAVQNLRVTSVSNGVVSLDWNAPLSNGVYDNNSAHLTYGYRIEQSNDQGATWQLIAMRPITGDAYRWQNIGGLVNGQTYQFRVTAVNDMGAGAPVIISAVPSTTPMAPRNVSVVMNDTNAALSWSAPDSDGGSPLTGYRVTYCTTADCSPSTSVTTDLAPTVTSFTVTGLNRGTTHTFLVDAVNANGKSVYGGQVTALAITTPAAVANLRASNASNAVTVTNPDGTTATAYYVGIDWDAPSTNGGSAMVVYKVEVSTDNGTSWSTLSNATVSLQQLWAPNPSAAGTIAQFRVTPSTSAGAGPASTISVVVPNLSIAGPPSKPSAPTSLSATGGDSAVTLGWAPPLATGGLPVTGYLVEQSTTSATSGYSTIAANVAPAQSGNTTFTVNGLTNGTTHWFRVSAINAAGSGATSVVHAAPRGLATAPATFTYTAGSPQATLTWTAPSDMRGGGIAGYQLERSTDSGTTWLQLTSGSSFGTLGMTANVTPPAPGTAVTYRVRALTGVGFGDWAYISAATPAATPAYFGVVDLRGASTVTSVSAGAVQIDWTAPANTSGLTGYKIERCGSASCTYTTLVASQTATTYTDATAVPGTGYVYRVTTVGTNAVASTVPVLTHGVVPHNTSAFTATSGNAQVSLSWTALNTIPAGIVTNGYRIEMCSSNCASQSATWTTLVTKATGATSMTVGGLNNGTTYTFRLSVGTAFGWGASTTASATPTGAPAAPGMLLANAGNGKVTLTWNTPTNLGGGALLGWKIEQGQTNAWTSLVTVTSLADPARTSFTVDGLVNGTAYWFRVSAVTTVDTGAYAVTSGTPAAVASAPSNALATVSASRRNSLYIDWGAPAYTGGYSVVGYRIERSTDGRTWTVVQANTGITTSWYANGLTNGQAYQFRISAITRAGYGEPAIASGTPMYVPSQPLNVTTVAGNQKIDVTWSAPVDDGGSPIIGYRIDLCTESSANVCATAGNWTTKTANTGLVTRYTVSGLTNGTTYAVRVYAVNEVGPSDQGSTYTYLLAIPAAPPIPPYYAYVTAADRSLTLTWGGANANGYAILGYRIEMTADGGTTWTTVQSHTYRTDLSSIINGLTNGVTYGFRVSAISNAGIGAPSPVTWGTPRNTTTGGVPNLRATTLDGRVVLNWSAPNDTAGMQLVGYRIWVSGATSYWANENTQSLSTSYTVYGLTNGTSYTFRVYPVTSNGWNGYGEVIARPQTLATPPTNFRAVFRDRQVLLTWEAPASIGADSGYRTGYRIERSPDGGTWSPMGMVGPNNVNWLATGLTNGQTYWFRIALVTTVGQGAWSTTSAIPVGRSLPPTHFRVEMGDRSASLSWQAPQDTGGMPVVGYRLFYNCTADNDSGVALNCGNLVGGTVWTTLVSILPASQTSYTVNGLTNGNIYNFAVQAITGGGGVWNGGSSYDGYLRDGVNDALIAGSAGINLVAYGVNQYAVGAPSAVANLAVTTSVSASTTKRSANAVLTWAVPTWSGGEYVGGYRIEQSTDGSTWTVLTPNTGWRDTYTYTVSGLDPTVRYWFRVAAVGVTGLRGPWSALSVIAFANADAPQNLRSSRVAGSNQVLVQWAAPSFTGGAPIVGYRIERSLDGTTWYVQSPNTGLVTSLLIDGYDATTRLYVRVAALTWGVGDYALTTSDVAAVQAGGLRFATVVGNGFVNLSWGGGTGYTPTSYRIERRNSGAATWDTVTADAGAVLTYRIAGLVNGTSYDFRVTPIQVVSGATAYGTASTVTAVPSAPAAGPGLLTATSGNASTDLSWTAPNNLGGGTLLGYMIERSTTSATAGFTVVTSNTGSTATSATIGGLANGTQYWFRVTAVTDLAGATGASAVTSVIPVVPGRAVGILSAQPGNNQAVLTWTHPQFDDAATDYIGYRVERSVDGTVWTTIAANVGKVTTYTATGLVNGTAYWFKVTTIGQTQDGGSSVVSTVPATYSARMPQLTATASPNKVELNWTEPTDTGGLPILGYAISRCYYVISSPTHCDVTHSNYYSYYNVHGLRPVNNDVNAVAFVGPSVRSFTFNTTSAKEFFRVVPITAVGIAVGTFTGANTMYTNASLIMTQWASNPGPVTSLYASYTSSNLGVHWAAPANLGNGTLVGYDVEQSNDNGATWMPLGRTVDLDMAGAGAPSGMPVQFRVRAVTDNGTGDWTYTTSSWTDTPTVPRNVGATVTGSTMFMSWQAPENTSGLAVLGYEVQYSLSGGAFTTYTGTGVGYTQTSFQWSAGVGTWYPNNRWQVRAIINNPAGTSSPGTNLYSNWVTITAPIVGSSSVVSSPTVTVDDALVNLAWTAPSDLGGGTLVNYRVEYSTDGTAWLLAGQTTGTSMAVRGLTNGTQYQFRITPYTTNGAGAQTVLSAMPYTAPGAPSNMRATAGNGFVTVNWGAPVTTGGRAVSGYEIDLCTTTCTTASNWTQYVRNTGTPNVLTYTFTGLVNGTQYNVRVSAVTAACDETLNDQSAGSCQKYGATVMSTPATISNAVQRLSATVATSATYGVPTASGRVSVSWVAPDSNGGASIYGYRVEYSTDGISWTTFTQNMQALNLDLTGLAPGVLHHIRVVPLSSEGDGMPSTTSIVAPAWPVTTTVPNMVSGLRTMVSPTSIFVQWNAPTGPLPTGYRIQLAATSNNTYYAAFGTWAGQVTTATMGAAATTVPYAINGTPITSVTITAYNAASTLVAAGTGYYVAITPSNASGAAGTTYGYAMPSAVTARSACRGRPRHRTADRRSCRTASSTR